MKTQGQFEEKSRARRRALQAVYQWQITGQDVDEIRTQFFEEQNFSNVDTTLFRSLLEGVVKTRSELDDFLRPFLDRPVSQLDVMEAAILRIAAFELNNYPELPLAVLIDEAIDLARRFGAEQGHSFVNGVLDRAARNRKAAGSTPKGDAPD